MTQIGHKIDFLQILYVNYTLSGYFKNTFRSDSKCFLLQLTGGGGPLVDKNGHSSGTKHLQFDAFFLQFDTVG